MYSLHAGFSLCYAFFLPTAWGVNLSTYLLFTYISCFLLVFSCFLLVSLNECMVAACSVSCMLACLSDCLVYL
jgi:hypothetical protein